MRLEGYVWKPVVGLANDPKIIPRLGILHIDGGGANSLFDWFNGPSRGIESHAFIPRSDRHDLEQFRDTTREADANWQANSWTAQTGELYGGLSFETQGRDDGTIWSEYQLHEIKRAMKMCEEEHDIPLRIPEGPKGRGWGFHTMFPAWSNVSGKSCPGAARKRQFNDILVPWMANQRKLIIDVAQGDTWAGLAMEHNTTVLELVKMNRPLKAGERLRVR